MTPLAAIVRAELRRRWRPVLVMTLLIGLAGAVVLSTAAGARRTASSLHRFSDFSRTSNLELNLGLHATTAQVDRLERTPGIAEMARLWQFSLTLDKHEFLPIAASIDGKLGKTIDRARLIRGRSARPSAPNEIEVGEKFAERLHVKVGDSITFFAYTPEQIESYFAGQDGGIPTRKVRLRVVGIVRRPLDLAVRGSTGGVIVLTPAFYREHLADIGSFGGVIARIRTVHPADAPRVIDAARSMFPRDEFDAQGLGIETEGAQDAIDVLALALWLFAAVAGVASLVVLGTMVSRQLALTRRDQRTFATLGLTRSERTFLTGGVLLPAAVLGSLMAIVVAALASPLFPFGVAGRAEPDPGFSLDAAILGIGGLVVVALVAVVIMVAAWRVTALTSASRTAITRTSGVARAASAAGLAPAPTIGVRFALEPGHGASTLPVRSAIAGAVAGILGVISVVVIGASLDRLVTTPALYGWRWDVAVARPILEDSSGQTVCGPRRPDLLDDRSVQTLGVACITSLTAAGRPVSGIAFRSVRGHTAPTIVDGRAPRRDDEVALGAVTLAALDKRVGDSVRVDGRRSARFVIVGEAAFPSFQDGATLADGVALNPAGMRRLVDKGAYLDYFLLVTYRPGTKHTVKSYNFVAGEDDLPAIQSKLPSEVDRLRQVDQLPVLLGIFLAVLAAFAVVHALVTAVRRRRRDLAVLRTFGFQGRQLGSTIGWQSVTMAVAGLLAGIPLGLAIGRQAWNAIAESLGVPSQIRVPVAALVAEVLAAVVLAVLVAIVPARHAARTRPAVVLRDE